MPMIRAMRMLNAVEAGTLTGAQLQTLLTADPGRLAELNVLLGMRGQARRMAASSTAMAAVIASSTAMAAVVASSTAMAAVAASSTAMAEVIANSNAMAAVAASSTAMAEVNANDQAVRIWMLAGTNQVWSNFASVAAVAASSTAMAAVVASSTAMAAVAASSTAMAAVIASSTAMAAVVASSTAMAAVAASSTAMAAVAASSTAMAEVIGSQVALNAVFANATAKATFKGSTAFTAASIPTMTGNATPSGAASASTIQGAAYEAWKGFDKSAASWWMSASGSVTNQWLRYDFPAPVFIHSLAIGNTQAGENRSAKNCHLEYSDDGATWSAVVTMTLANNTPSNSYDVSKAGKHRYWRLFVLNNYGDANFLSIADMSLTGFN